MACRAKSYSGHRAGIRRVARTRAVDLLWAQGEPCEETQGQRETEEKTSGAELDMRGQRDMTYAAYGHLLTWHKRAWIMFVALLCILVAASLSGCTLTPAGAQATAAVDAALTTGVADVQHFNDKALEIGSKAICATSIGSFHRLQRGNVKAGIAMMCGLQPDDLQP
jgi:hypothetical protein